MKEKQINFSLNALLMQSTFKPDQTGSMDSIQLTEPEEPVRKKPRFLLKKVSAVVA